MSSREEGVRRALEQVTYPGFERDIVRLGLVRGLSVSETAVRVELDPGPGGPAAADTLRAEIERAVSAVMPDAELAIELRPAAPSPAGGLRMAGPPKGAPRSGGIDAELIPDVRHVVAVASGKGGVGKSTVAVNLAVALSRRGLQVGLMDADIYGPSIPRMMGVRDRPMLDPDGRRLVPFERHGVKLMSIGFLVEAETAVIWRGPMVMKAVEQLLRDVAWGPLDVLVVDMPPGTGDAQLTLSQRVRLAGAVVVSTPQAVALEDVLKAVNMFRKVGVPVLGLVENMSRFVCPHCDEPTDIFGHGGAREEAARLDVPCLGEVPLVPAIRDRSDSGTPIAIDQGSPHAAVFDGIAAGVVEALEQNGNGDDDTAGPGLLSRFRARFGGDKPAR